MPINITPSSKKTPAGFLPVIQERNNAGKVFDSHVMACNPLASHRAALKYARIEIDRIRHAALFPTVLDGPDYDTRGRR